MSLKTLIGTALLVFAVISSNPAQAIDINSIDLEALKAEAEKWGVECDTSTPIKINTCRKRISNAQKQAELTRLKADTERTRQETLEKVRDLQDFVNKEGDYEE
ncbi:MAG: hypothetical protein LBJ14_08155 [Desulfarculales bacterium]|jgi:Tfp pilus assembly protein PilV|nr:hypothetical protein [Desulfarculales bacterium]